LFTSESGETMFTVAFAEAVFDVAARAGVLRARAASAPAEISSFFIVECPHWFKIRLPRPKSRHP
jgi:hypothetical protein